KPNVMIGVHSGALYLGLKDWIFQLSVEGGEVLGRWDSEARSGRVSARAPLDGRPVIGGSTLYWPSSVGLITIDLSSGKLPDKAQEFIDGNFGNLQVARGALVNFAGKAYISSLDIAGVLEVRFDQSELLAQAEREVKANPMDPRAKLRLVQLAQQIEGVEGFDIERIEALLREVISLAEGKADTADVLASARRSLFDVLVAKAQRALSSQDFVAFPRFMQEAGALADSDAQRLTIFLLEESYAIDKGDVEGKIAFYSRIAAASPRFSLSLRGLNVPSRVYALWNLAGLYSQSKQGAQALACLDQILGWGQSDGATSGLLQEVQQQISTIYFSTPEAYQGLDEDAAQAFADASSHTGVASAREMLALADRYRHSGVFTQALRQAAIRSADDEAFLA
ncbi:MAG: hypothetical protein KDB07_13905, partial [Planctomycetes bacterium]|nr:hypothetical protein [Planctomycetota bacterium]